MTAATSTLRLGGRETAHRPENFAASAISRLNLLGEWLPRMNFVFGSICLLSLACQ